MIKLCKCDICGTYHTLEKRYKILAYCGSHNGFMVKPIQLRLELPELDTDGTWIVHYADPRSLLSQLKYIGTFSGEIMDIANYLYSINNEYWELEFTKFEGVTKVGKHKDVSMELDIKIDSITTFTENLDCSLDVVDLILDTYKERNFKGKNIKLK